MMCILGDGRRITVRFISEGGKNTNQKRLKKRRPTQTEVVSAVKTVEEKKEDAEVNLLDKLLSAFQNLQRE